MARHIFYSDIGRAQVVDDSTNEHKAYYFQGRERNYEIYVVSSGLSL